MYSASGKPEDQNTNELFGNQDEINLLKKRRIKYAEQKNSTQPIYFFLYMVLGQLICLVSMLTGFNKHKIALHARKASMAPEFLVYET